MQINSNLYNEVGKNGIFGYSNSIHSLVSSGKLELNTSYDESFCTWYSTNLYSVPNVIEYRTANLISTGKNAKIGFVINNSNASVGKGTLSVGKTGPSSSIIAWSPNQTSNNWYTYAQNKRVITSFKYSNIRLLIYVQCSATAEQKDNSGNEGTYHYTLDTYLKNYTTTYPYIIRIYCKPAYGDSATRELYTGNSTTTFGSYIGANVSYKNTEYTPVIGGYSGCFPVFGCFSVEYESPLNFSCAISDDFTTMFYGNYSDATWLDFYGIRRPYMRYFDGFKDFCIKAACGYGLPVCTTTAAAQTGTIDSEDTYIAKIENGNVTQTITHGKANLDLDQIDWENGDAWDKGGFDPTREPDPNSYTDKIDLAKPSLSTVGVFNRSFAMTAGGIYQLSDFLWNGDETIFNQIIEGLKLLGDNPLNAIIDLRLYPFNVTRLGSGDSKSIVIGRTDTGVQGIELSNSVNCVLDMGSCSFYRTFNNFLDYEPFTTASLYIPYCGIVSIPTAEFVDKNISVKLIVDITTGSCTAVIFVDNIPYLYKNGAIGIDVSMSGTDSAAYSSKILNGIVSGSVNTAMGVATGNVGQAAGGAMGLVNTGLSLNNSSVHTTGSSSPACGFWQPQNCYFIIRRPIVNMPENYGHTVGYACNYQAKIADCKGYTQTYNVDVSTINAPEEEKNEIARILNTGFFA